MPQNFTQVRIRGMNTFNSDLNTNQPETLQDCNNIVINRDNIAEPRRGLKLYGNAMGSSPTTDYAHQLLQYKRRILRHFGGSGTGTTLQFDNGSGTFASFSGTYSETEQGLRIKGLEANGNFYFTTSNGIQKISAATADELSTAANYITDAGGIKALDLNGQVDYSQTGFLPANSVVAYRVVWGIKDANTNLVLGAPSARLVISNPSEQLLTRDINRLLNSLDVAAAADGGDALSDTDYLSTLKIDVNADAGTIFTTLTSLCTKLDADIGGTTYATIAAGHVAPSSTPTITELDDLRDFYDEIVDALLAEPAGDISPAAQAAGNFQNSTQSAVTQLEFTIPEDVTTAHFYQIYRTLVSTATGATQLDDLDPGDEQKLAFEANPSSADLSAGYIAYTDIVPESFLGANLYTNPQTGEGIAQANEIPPLAKDIALFKESVFFANTQTKHRKNLSLLGVTNLVSGVSTITITDGNVTNKYTFVEGVAQVTEITAIPGADFVSSGTSDYFDIYSANDVNHYRVWFQSGTSVAPASGGATLVQVTITGVETDVQVAVKIYEALNVYNDFIMAEPLTAVLTVTNVDTGITTNATETVADVDFTTVTTIEGDGEDVNTQQVLLSTADTPAKQVDETARSLVKVINRNSNESIYAFYLSGPTDVPGQMLFESKELGTDPFYVLANDSDTGESFNPVFSPTNTITSITMANPTVVTSGLHGLVTGDQIFIANSSSTPLIDGIFTVTVTGVNTFTIPVNVTVAGTEGVFILLENAEVSDNEVTPNRIYFSKTQQPEAVPLVNFFDVGPKDQAIKRILPLRDSLFVLKEDGIYRVSGEGAISGFAKALFDSSTTIQAPDSAVVLNNQIYMFSEQGISIVTDTGVEIVSRSIEDLLIPRLLDDNFSTVTFGVSYESDRSYLVWTTTLPEDTKATQCFRFNSFTNSWTKWEISKTSGLVVGDRLYTGAGDTNFIEQERKSFNRTDYADREHGFTLAAGNTDGMIVDLGSVANLDIGDVLFQEQYLTIYKLNQLLLKLDDDPTITDKTYFSDLEAEVGENLRDILTALATKLDNDADVGDNTFSAAIAAYTSSFVDTQSAYNVIVNKLNLNSNLVFSNYPLSSGTVKYEAIIESINTDTTEVTLNIILPLIAGPVLVFEHIPIVIEFNPQYFGDSELFKQVSEAKFIFDRTNFTKAEVSYSTDVSPSFQEFEFEKQGNGAFGMQVFGETNFGGNGDKTPFRTLVPRDKQRCRFLRPKIAHSIAREKMSVIGYSMFFTSYSQRPYAR